MNITADTNLLLRAFLRDDPVQSELAIALLQDASRIAVPLPVLCEMVWVLIRLNKINREVVAVAVEKLLDAPNVLCNRAAVEHGLQLLKSGGDFADGVIAFEGRQMGGETFVSFDKEAIVLLEKQGFKTHLLQ